MSSLDPPQKKNSVYRDVRSVIIAVVLVTIIFPLCTLRRLDSLKFTSGISVMLATMFITATVSLGIVKAARSPAKVR